MRVTHRLASQSLAAIPAEAAWAESIGYDALSKNETAHDSFLPLTLAATSTTRAMLQTSVAIAFPRSPMIAAYTAHDLQDLSRGRFRLGPGNASQGAYRAALLHVVGVARPASSGIRAGVA